jgi:hypothetical protein
MPSRRSEALHRKDQMRRGSDPLESPSASLGGSMAQPCCGDPEFQLREFARSCVGRVSCSAAQVSAASLIVVTLSDARTIGPLRHIGPISSDFKSEFRHNIGMTRQVAGAFR